MATSPTSPSLMSPTGSFSVLSSIETRSRSSSLSYQNVDAGDETASLSQSFSELSSNGSRGAPHDDEYDDEFILIPAGSSILNNSNSTAQSQLLVVPEESTSAVATPFVGYRRAVELEEDSDTEGEEEQDSTGVNEDEVESEDEERIRAQQRLLRMQDFTDAPAADSGSESGDDLVLPTASRIQSLSLSLQATRAPSSLSVQTLTRPVTATPVPSRRVDLAPAAPLAQPQTAQAPTRPPRNPEQLEKRRLKKQRAKERRKEKKRQQSLSDSGSSTTAAGHSSDGSVGNSAYDDAVAFITKYLSNPPQQPSVAQQLHLLQSIITELGLLTGNTPMPRSITAAKKIIKNQVHINVKDYLKRRLKQVEVAQMGSMAKQTVQVGVGVAEMKKLMFPSKPALMQSLRSNKKNVMSRQAIKKAGLNVFMVVVFH
ncbi:hypothetical protein FRB90_010335 [Tulasnella sp. 427]|nr:hypothetical protein FRB90_010335 [Tulasnella sp. 427]